MTRHMSLNLAGFLRNMGKRKIHRFFQDDKGNYLNDKQAREYIAECQAKGWKVIPMTDKCEGFDYSGGGCPGHITLETE